MKIFGINIAEGIIVREIGDYAVGLVTSDRGGRTIMTPLNLQALNITSDAFFREINNRNNEMV